MNIGTVISLIKAFGGGSGGGGGGVLIVHNVVDAGGSIRLDKTSAEIQSAGWCVLPVESGATTYFYLLGTVMAVGDLRIFTFDAIDGSGEVSTYTAETSDSYPFREGAAT